MAGESNNKPVAAEDDTVTWSAFKVSLGSLFGLIAGLGSQVLVALIFGAGAEMDAFLTALVVPLYAQSVLLAGLPFVLIPAFVQEEIAGDEDKAWAITGTFFLLTAGILMTVAAFGSLFAERIIGVSAPGLSAAKADIAARMLAILMFAVPLSGLGSLTTGIQNARNRFFWPAASAAVGSVANMTMLLVLYHRLGPLALAWGYLASEGLKASVTVVPVLRHGWRRLLPLSDRRLREMARLIAPFVIFGIFRSSTSVFERYFASGLPDGDLSYLGYANKISKIVMALVGSAIATAAFPAMARAYLQHGEDKLIEKAEYGLRLTLAVALPILSILSAVAVPLVSVLFERGAFRHIATQNVSRILPMVIMSNVVCGMLGYVIGRTYYVTKDTDTQPAVGAVAAVLYVILARVFVDAWGYVGLAFAAVLVAASGVFVLLFLLMRKLKSFRTRKLLGHGLVYGTASLAAFLGARLVSSVLASLPAFVQLLAASIVSGTLYLAILFATDRDIALAILDMTGVQRIATGVRVAFHRLAETTLG